LQGVSLALQPGEALGLMGDNGAGKSTLIKLLSGNFLPDSGVIKIEGRVLSFNSPSAARAHGIETVYQDLAVAPNLSAAQNIYLGKEPRRFRFIPGIIDHTAVRSGASALFARLQSDTPPDALVKNLSGGQRQAVAIARALIGKAKIVILDEPTAAISVRQVTQVLDLVRRLSSEGIAVILISHRMPDIFETCSHVVVLRRERKVADTSIAKTSPQKVTGLITGAIDSI
jgi:simple sugar transport system ATP-binding protein